MGLLLAVAILPGLYLLRMVYNLDKIEKEPLDLLRKLFFGGVIALFPVIICENLAGSITNLLFTPKTTLYNVVEFFLGVALVEEGFKYYFLKKYTWNHPAFDYRFDAVVYAVCVSMGFAVIENIFYVMEHGLEVGIMRAFTSIPGHGMFAIYMGLYYGLAKLYAKRGYLNRVQGELRKALWVPVLLHGFYDFCLADGAEMVGVFFVFISIMYYRTYSRLKQFAREDERLV